MRTSPYIDGQWRADGGDAHFVVENPATGAELAAVTDATVPDALLALDAAARAAEPWAATPPRRRAEILRRAYELCLARADELTALITAEMGKSLAEARAEVLYGAEFFRWFSEIAAHDAGRYTVNPVDGEDRFVVARQPVGPCVLVVPWNFPLAMITRKVGPALAAGCTSVIKPAALTPLTTLACVDILEQAGLPAGVVNVVPTTRAAEVVAALLTDPRTRKLSFTGSTEVGMRLLQTAAGNVLRTSMELGGNAPFLVFQDADLQGAAQAAATAKMRNIGQSCTAANRFLVHESVAPRFTELLAERLRRMRVGDGAAPGTDVGPLVDGGARAGVAELVDAAVERGATAVLGGRPLDGPGYFYAPTVLRIEDPEAPILGEEIFGPVAPVATFATEAEAIALANRTQLGLAAFVCSSDLRRALRVGEALQAGMVGINRGIVSNVAAPFGGVAHSGLGREGGLEGIEEFLEPKTIAFSLAP
jgi:succinate-semialdehyde dehydrogenase/glutarate-semialdehyde dehydrogenase